MSTKKQLVELLSAERDVLDNIQQFKEIENASDYKAYPPGEDIYISSKQEQDINPENISKKKVPNELSDAPNENDFSNGYDGDDLDVPGAELDDEDEKIGEEDEENNYYSIGGDNHNNLEEDHID